MISSTGEPLAPAQSLDKHIGQWTDLVLAGYVRVFIKKTHVQTGRVIAQARNQSYFFYWRTAVLERVWNAYGDVINDLFNVYWTTCFRDIYDWFHNGPLNSLILKYLQSS